MRAIRQFGNEVSAIFRNKKLLVQLTAILMVPVLYSGLFLGAFWDPYEKMNELPVAIVNADRGVEYNGKQIDVGGQFTDKLKENTTFQWHFVNKATAEDGLRSNKYYMAIEIPEDFSAQTTTLTSDTPHPAVLRYLPNESLNFLAGQIGDTAVKQMKQELSSEVTKTYARTVFDQFSELAGGLETASGGALEIADGSLSAKDGAEQIAAQLHKLTEGATSLQDGVHQLSGGSDKLRTGAASLHDGSQSLSSGLGKLVQAGQQLNGGAADADAAAKQLAAGLKKSEQGAAALQAGASKLSESLDNYAAAVPSLAEDPTFQQLVAASKTLAAGAQSAAEGQQQLAAGSEALSGGTGKLTQGITKLQSGLTEASSGSSRLVTGADALQKGTVQLKEGFGKLENGALKVQNGSAQLATGADKLTDGLTSLTAGSSKLSGKLGEAAEATGSLKPDDKMIEMFASPIASEVQIDKEVPNYGTGFAPYFISLGLFVGSLLLTIVFTIKEPAVKPSSGWSWFTSKLLVMTVIGLLQAAIVNAVLIYALGMEVQHIGLFFLFSFITSFCFMTLMQFLVSAFDLPGRFIAIVILIFQLTTSAGTFPLELIPDWMQAFHAWLPMSYSVFGFKAVISSGDYSAMWHNAGALLLFAGVFSVLSLAYLSFTHHRTVKQGKAALTS
ncbi:YhgE/Pip domain-containing protein [Paenibacillaceae bacterium]|nr:YhgE/Pip domain-containing protein [Paenibacillaceae bacterium]